MIGFVLALAFALLLCGVPLAHARRARVVGLNLLSVGAAFGLMAAVFQHSWAEGLLGFRRRPARSPSWLPLFSFVILFGLSMDYTVLVLERIREARRAGRIPAAAAARGHRRDRRHGHQRGARDGRDLRRLRDPAGCST